MENGSGGGVRWLKQALESIVLHVNKLRLTQDNPYGEKDKDSSPVTKTDNGSTAADDHDGANDHDGNSGGYDDQFGGIVESLLSIDRKVDEQDDVGSKKWRAQKDGGSKKGSIYDTI